MKLANIQYIMELYIFGKDSMNKIMNENDLMFIMKSNGHRFNFLNNTKGFYKKAYRVRNSRM